MRKPDFEQMLKVLHREKPDRPTLYEFYMNDEVYLRLGGKASGDGDFNLCLLAAFAAAGYDYSTVIASGFFPHREAEHEASYSLNGTVTIASWDDFERYPWRKPQDCFDYDWLKVHAGALPGGMKFIPAGPGGVLENLILLMGYDNLCLSLTDDPALVRAIADRIGETLLEYYRLVLGYDSVGACMVNDDWGFNSQPMLSPAAMRELIIPWHRRIVAAIHEAGRPALLHCCGNLETLMDDIIDDIGFDAKHSFEDKIMPVEEAYDRYSRRIAILGGIDLDFLCRSTPEAVAERSRKMLERASAHGAYALGSGNSIPSYVPIENYLAMIGVIGE